MKIRNVTVSQMEQALRAANKVYAGNLEFNRFDVTGKVINFTLRVKSSKAPGHRVSFMGRRIPSACWHAHKKLLEAIFNIQPRAVLISCHATYRGKKNFKQLSEQTGDINIGSIVNPLYYRHSCDC